MKFAKILFLVLSVQLFAAVHAQACDRHQEMKPNKPLLDDSIYQLSSIWKDSASGKFSLASLRGSPVVMAMIFTSCPGACPLTVADLKRIENGLTAEQRARVRFVLVSFDPDTDTPSVLKKFQTTHNITAKNWTLLTGSKSAVRDLTAVLGVKYKQLGRGNFSHSNVITILDAEGVVQYQQLGLRQDPALSIAKVGQMVGTRSKNS